MSSFDVNKMILVGNVGKMPEERKFDNGGSVVKLTLATNESWKDKKSGEYVTNTEWHTVVCFNEFIQKSIMNNVEVGTKIYVEGESRTRTYEKDGHKNYVQECVIPKFSGEMKVLVRSSSGADAQPLPSGAPDFNDDVPF